jgi:hypothetical protein
MREDIVTRVHHLKSLMRQRQLRKGRIEIPKDWDGMRSLADELDVDYSDLYSGSNENLLC